MSVKNTKLGGTNWYSGELAKADDLNDTFNNSIQIIYHRDLTSYKITGSNVSYTTAKSVSVPANTFKRLMFIDVYYRLFAVNDDTYASSGKIKLVINGSDAYEIPVIARNRDIKSDVYLDSMITVPFRNIDDVDLTNPVLVEVDVGIGKVSANAYEVSAECKGLVIRGI